MTQLLDVPLFPLQLVMLPSELVPLHIFEPRYREMIAHCVQHDAPFCIVLIDEAGMRTVGCLTDSIEVLERLEDGRINLVASGGEIVRIDRVDPDRHAYLSAEVTVQADDPSATADPAAVETALESYRTLLHEIGAPADASVDEDEPLSYALAARVELPLELKQALLESRAEGDRLARVTAALEEGRRGLREATERAQRASTNGKLSHGD